MRQILPLASTAVSGEMFQRQDDGTWPQEAQPLAAEDAVRIEAVGFACRPEDFYARTRLAPP